MLLANIRAAVESCMQTTNFGQPFCASELLTARAPVICLTWYPFRAIMMLEFAIHCNHCRKSRTTRAVKATGRAAGALRTAVLQELSLQGGELVPSASGYRQSGVAPRGAVPARWLHYHEFASCVEEYRGVLQPARHSRAMHQRMEGRVKRDT